MWRYFCYLWRKHQIVIQSKHSKPCANCNANTSTINCVIFLLLCSERQTKKTWTSFVFHKFINRAPKQNTLLILRCRGLLFIKHAYNNLAHIFYCCCCGSYIAYVPYEFQQSAVTAPDKHRHRKMCLRNHFAEIHTYTHTANSILCIHFNLRSLFTLSLQSIPSYQFSSSYRRFSLYLSVIS